MSTEPLIKMDGIAPLSYANEIMASLYEEYVGTDGHKHKTRVATANSQWVVKATDGKVLTIKFDKNFVKKHIFTYTKKDITGGASIMDMSILDLQDLPNKAKNANDAKLLKQAKHRTNDEQRLLCKTCGHEEKRHKTGSGRPAPKCKDKAPDGITPCPCTVCNPFVSADPVAIYEKNRTAKGKPTTNPLAGATTNKTTYIIMNEIPKNKFENTVAHTILAETWTRGDKKHIDWNFNTPGCVITVEVDKAPNQWAKGKGATVSIEDVTNDPSAPTYVVYHFNAMIV